MGAGANTFFFFEKLQQTTFRGLKTIGLIIKLKRKYFLTCAIT